MDKILTGIVVNTADYKEADQLLTVVTPDVGRVVLYARGLNKPASKNAGACRLFSESEFLCDYTSDNRRQLLKSASLKNGRPQLQKDYQRLVIASLVIEIAARIDSDEPIYELLSAALDKIEAGNEPYTAASLFIGGLLAVMGIEPEVDECVLCGSTEQIVAISLADGGFLCKNCNATLQQPVLPSTLLHNFRVINKANFSVYDRIVGLGLNDYTLLSLQVNFLIEHSGLQLNSLRSLQDEVQNQAQ